MAVEENPLISTKKFKSKDPKGLTFGGFSGKPLDVNQKGQVKRSKRINFWWVSVGLVENPLMLTKTFKSKDPKGLTLGEFSGTPLMLTEKFNSKDPKGLTLGGFS